MMNQMVIKCLKLTDLHQIDNRDSQFFTFLIYKFFKTRYQILNFMGFGLEFYFL